VDKEGNITNRNKEIIGKQKNPSAFKSGKDKYYFTHFYDILSRISHCNYGTADYYFKNHLFTVEKVNDPLLIRLFVIFIFTKLFELIVTVEGEDFLDARTEKSCYQLVRDSIALQEDVFDFLIDFYKEPEEEDLKSRNRRMRNLLKDMKKSLKEELGSVKKS
jgi:hypothetical protein